MMLEPRSQIYMTFLSFFLVNLKSIPVDQQRQILEVAKIMIAQAAADLHAQERSGK